MFPPQTYEGPNESHRKFCNSYRYLNALYYLVVACRGQLQTRLNEDLKKPGIAVGIVTHVISNTQVQFVSVHKEDARAMAVNFDGFLSTFRKQTIVSAYLLDLSPRNKSTVSEGSPIQFMS